MDITKKIINQGGDVARKTGEWQRLAVQDALPVVQISLSGDVGPAPNLTARALYREK